MLKPTLLPTFDFTLPQISLVVMEKLPKLKKKFGDYE